jgi:SNF2 family DNA or RNA helicase
MTVDPNRFDPNIPKAVGMLSSVCDGAHEHDGSGFNGVDASFWNNIARDSSTVWSPRLYELAYKMLRKYKKQLRRFGIDFDAIIAPALERYIRKGTKNDRIAIFFDYSKQILENLKMMGLSDLKFHKDETTGVSYWHCEPTSRNVRLLRAFAESMEFQIRDDAETLFASLENGTYVAPAIPATPVRNDSPTRKIHFYNNVFVLVSPFDARLVDDIKSYFVSRKFEKMLGPYKNAWTVKPSVIKDFADFENWIKDHDFELAPEAESKLNEIATTRIELFDFSNRYDSSFSIDGLKLNPYGFQNVGMEFLTKLNGGLVADEPGLGKTIQAIGAVRSKNAFPCVVICPANIKIKWAREVEKWTDHKTFIVHSDSVRGFKGRSGQLTPDVIERIKGGEFEFIVINYELSFRHENVSRLRSINPAAIILDEIHYLINHKTKRTNAISHLISGKDEKIDDKGNVVKQGGKVVWEQVHQGIPVRYALTGTPILNRPVELISILQVIGVFSEIFPAQMYEGSFVSSWEYFVRRYCDGHKEQVARGKSVWITSGSSNEEELHQVLRQTCMIRRKKSEVLKDLPPKQHNRIPVSLSNQAEYDKAEKNFFKWIREEYKLNDEEMEKIQSLKSEDREGAIYHLIEGKVDAARRAETLTHLNALKQICARGKKESAVEWIKDFISSGEKLVVFSIYRDTQKMLMDEFKGENVAHIFSTDGLATRDEQIQKFQTDPNCKLMFAALGTTAVSSPATQGIELHAASNVLFLEFGWNPALHEQAADRVHRIGQLAESIFIWWMYAEGSVDDFCLSMIEGKQEVISAIVDGKEMGDYSPNMIDGVISKMIKNSVA